MTEKELDARDRIIRATIDILDEEENLNKITVRRIAERAGVGVGLINYHFQTKENLLNEAVLSVMSQEAGRWLQPAEIPDADPLVRLRVMIRQVAGIAIRYPKFAKILISHALLRGNMEAESMVLPTLRQILGPGRDETQVRLIAFQLIASMQVAFMRENAFRNYSGINISDDRQRDQAIDTLVDNLLNL
jgi:AcrR family transcriptional regulator